MFSPTTAPDVTETVTKRIREHRNYLNTNPGYTWAYSTDRETVGRFSGVVQAVVEVELHIKFSKNPGQRPDWVEAHTVQFAAAARCAGHGCPDSVHEVAPTDEFLLDADADETAPAALPLVAAAQAWAQQHAEACRALPYDGR
ncbi:hypothetical protein [Streptomyces sp. NPDC048442]|uniref:hypothetical protein n=1 Tax=Streptomyces sp. NPDC048442 TaxID=3154823 RepID=UPI003418C5D5